MPLAVVVVLLVELVVPEVVPEECWPQQHNS
jgi:hypothetical protein